MYLKENYRVVTRLHARVYYVNCRAPVVSRLSKLNICIVFACRDRLLTIFSLRFVDEKF